MLMSDEKYLYTEEEKKRLLEGPSFLTRPGEARKLAKDIYLDRNATWALCDYLSAEIMQKRGIGEKIVLPDWVLDGVLEKLMDHMILELTVANGVGPTSLQLAKQTKDWAHSLRYLAVMELRKSGSTLEDAFESVAEETMNHPWEAKPVKAGAIRKSYRDVKKDTEEGGTRFYLPTIPKVRGDFTSHLEEYGVIKLST